VPGGMGGKETIENLLKLDANVKAFVSSGYSNDPIMSEYQKYGFIGVLAKPYSIQELRNILIDIN
jgi:FixJ family two-component response regulator